MPRRRHAMALRKRKDRSSVRPDPKGERRNQNISKKKEKALRRQLRNHLKEVTGLDKAEVDEMLPTTKQLKQAKQKEQQLALEAPVASSDAEETMDNAMDISEGAAGQGIGITLGAPTTFRQ